MDVRPTRLFQVAFAKFSALSPTVQVISLVAGLGALLYLPYLGAVGLWDCWETHYGEVARQMIHRADYVYPYWESDWFFSKPPFTMWMMAIGMKLVGANTPEAALARLTEWGMRVPFALFSITALCLLALAVTRTLGRRAGLTTVFALATMPLYFLLTRQAVTDTPFVSAGVCAMACALIAQFDEKTSRRSAWWYAFYVFCGIGVLAKGLLGIAVPAAVLLLYAVFFVVPWSSNALVGHLRWLTNAGFRHDVREGRAAMPVLWAQLYRMHFGTGLVAFLAVAGPWILTLSLFPELDDENNRFFYRFFIHDHFARFAAGVHTTTPGGDFTYFILQGGYGMFPWVALVPGALLVALRVRPKTPSGPDHVTFIAFIWALVSFGVVAASATKFHHYVLPVLPPMAVLIGRYVDELWNDDLANHVVPLLVGALFFALIGKDLADKPKNFTDLFVYNYDRPYPLELVTAPIELFALPTISIDSGGSLVFGRVPVAFNIKAMLGGAFAVVGVLCGASALGKLRTELFSVFGGFAFLFALWFGWKHWVDLSHHWTQRDLFWSYYDKRTSDTEPIAAFLMNWRGETFYSKNTVKQIRDPDPTRYQARLREYASLGGRKWALVEHNRLHILRGITGTDRVRVYHPELNNKFVLVSID